MCQWVAMISGSESEPRIRRCVKHGTASGNHSHIRHSAAGAASKRAEIEEDAHHLLRTRMSTRWWITYRRPLAFQWITRIRRRRRFFNRRFFRLVRRLLTRSVFFRGLVVELSHQRQRFLLESVVIKTN